MNRMVRHGYMSWWGVARFCDNIRIDICYCQWIEQPKPTTPVAPRLDIDQVTWAPINIFNAASHVA